MRRESLGEGESPADAEVSKASVVAADDVVSPVPEDMKGSVIVLVDDEFLHDLGAERVIFERVGHDRRTGNRRGPVAPLAVDHDLRVLR